MISVSDNVFNGSKKNFCPCLLKSFVKRNGELFTVGAREGEKNIIRVGPLRLQPSAGSPLVNNLFQPV